MKKWPSLLKQLITIVIILMAVELYQSRALISQLHPQVLTHSFETLEGETSTPLLSQKTPLTLVYAFAPWCQVCHLNASTLDLTLDDVSIIGLALSWGHKSEVQTFKSDTGFKPKILLAEDRWAAQLGVNSFPSYMLINSDGNVIYSWVGYSTSFGIRMKAFLAKLVS